MVQRSYIVTGAGGFIGARFVEAARGAGANLISVDLLDTFARAEHQGLDFGQKIDIDALAGFLERLPNAELPTAIVHLGACSDTMELDEAVHEKLNLNYSKMLWTWCTQRGVPLVYASSAATYGGGELGYDDDESKSDALQPLNPYGWSKQRFDLWALAEERAGRAPPRWTGFKFFNVYGFGERHKARMASVVMHSFDQIRDTGKVRLFRSHKEGYADGEQKRDFVYVDDVISVLFHATSDLERGIFNLGTGRARTFFDLAAATFRALGREPNIEFMDMPVALRERYQYFTEAKMDRLRAAGFALPFTSLEDGVSKYVQRLLAHAERKASAS